MGKFANFAIQVDLEPLLSTPSKNQRFGISINPKNNREIDAINQAVSIECNTPNSFQSKRLVCTGLTHNECVKWLQAFHQ